jgi:putative solute:sodium symporter small subunit
MTPRPSSSAADGDAYRDADAYRAASEHGLDTRPAPTGATRPPESPEGTPQRVRVTAPRSGSATASARLAPHAGTDAPTSDIAGVYVRSLIRSQLRLAIVFAVGFVVATAAFVLAITFVPELDTTFIFGVPVSWLLLGVGVYPLAITVGGLYVRAASRNEARYRSLTEVE